MIEKTAWEIYIEGFVIENKLWLIWGIFILAASVCVLIYLYRYAKEWDYCDWDFPQIVLLFAAPCFLIFSSGVIICSIVNILAPELAIIKSIADSLG